MSVAARVDPVGTGEPVGPDLVVQVASGFMAAKLLFAATEVGVFEALAQGPASLDELGARTGMSVHATRIVADAMVVLGFLERAEDGYRNAPVAAGFLSGAGPADLRPFVRFWNRISYPRWSAIEDALRGVPREHGDLSEDEHRVFSEGVEALTTGPAKALARVEDFARHRRVLDVGGGTGSFLVALLDRHPDLEGTLLELPATAAIARLHLASLPCAGRIAVVDGDALEAPLPPGHDAALVANLVHLLSPAQARRLFARLREALSEDAQLYLVDFWTDPTHTDPPVAALLAGEFLLHSDHGDVHSAEDVSAWLRAEGWRDVEHRPLLGPQSLLVARA